MRELKKHKYNILPIITGDDYIKLESDILKNGYDIRFPIYLYQDEIIDGWQRYTICKNHNINPIFEVFEGNDIEAFQFILRTNKRRNITSSQWAAVANEATEIITELETAAKERQIATQRHGNKPTVGQIIAPPEIGKTAEKVAEIFPTNKQYYKDAKKIKKEAPAEFEKIKSGEKTIPQVKREMQPEVKKDESNPFFYDTSRLLTRALDHLEKILQKDVIPKTEKDFIHIQSINNELYRTVLLAGKSGIDIKKVWEKLAERHGEKIEIPEHLKRPSNI